MTHDKRIAVYTAQRGGGRLTARQTRRANRKLWTAEVRKRVEAIGAQRRQWMMDAASGNAAPRTVS